eukprot:4873995-Amphidinium_carterae.1
MHVKAQASSLRPRALTYSREAANHWLGVGCKHELLYTMEGDRMLALGKALRRNDIGNQRCNHGQVLCLAGEGWEKRQAMESDNIIR